MVKQTDGPCDGTFLNDGMRVGLRCDALCGLGGEARVLEGEGL